MKSRVRGFLKVIRRTIKRISARAARREIAVSILFVSLLLGYLTVWGLYSLVSTKKAALPPAREIVIRKPEVAIVLDDAGGDFINYSEIYSIRENFTISILPNLKHSKKVAADAVAAGKEAILHLPMEPENPSYIRADGGMILTTMSDEKIREVVARDLSSVPSAVGVNNHMGSKATRDERVVRVFLAAIKKRGLFFLDSRTSRGSIAYRLAGENGIKSGRNEMFLDVVENEDAIAERLGELVSWARRRGSAIGIGHATRPATIAALKRLLPIYESEGVKFVFISSLVK